MLHLHYINKCCHSGSTTVVVGGAQLDAADRPVSVAVDDGGGRVRKKSSGVRVGGRTGGRVNTGRKKVTIKGKR